jgi:hypothetical protein
MTRLHDVTVGKFDPFKRVLAEADLDGELVDAVLKQPQLAGGMVGGFEPLFRREFAPMVRALAVVTGDWGPAAWVERRSTAVVPDPRATV